MDFSGLGLPIEILKSLIRQNISEPYPVQKEVVPAILNQKDVLGIAPTGSGKTAAYVLPLLARLQENTVIKNRFARVLVIVPTRELAAQVSKVFSQFSLGLNRRIKTIAVYGGVSINPQMIELQGVHILIATPGRLIELIEQRAVNISEVETLVIDEADKMLTVGFKEEISKILNLLPLKRQNLLFSATLNPEIEELNNLVLKNPEIINIQAEPDQINLIEQTGYFVPSEKKGPLLRYLIKSLNMERVLVFTSSTYQADNVADKLCKNGIDAASIHSKKSQGARTQALNEFKKGSLRVLVTTDLLARGIDIELLPFVINYELPRSPKDYIHRVGRTGRAENKGEAFTFVTPEDQNHFRVIQKKMKRWVTMVDSLNLELKGF